MEQTSISPAVVELLVEVLAVPVLELPLDFTSTFASRRREGDLGPGLSAEDGGLCVCVRRVSTRGGMCVCVCVCVWSGGLMLRHRTSARIG